MSIGYTNPPDVKQEVRQFYDQVGWQLVGDARYYQNARYEDLRPVARAYIHKCHMRVRRHLKKAGQYLLDAGSGPIQYPEYLEYSLNYQFRVCADISITALKEAQNRIGEHGLYVVADVANLPFRSGAFDGVVSLHTIHHLPEHEHQRAYQEIYRMLAPDRSAVVVNGWPTSSLMAVFEPFVRLVTRLHNLSQRLVRRTGDTQRNSSEVSAISDPQPPKTNLQKPKGTFTSRHNFAWVQNQIGSKMPIEIRVWRSVSVRFMRALIHPWLGGRFWLWLLYHIEERFPHYFGRIGQYPLIILQRPADTPVDRDGNVAVPKEQVLNEGKEGG